jgi:N utilization substance protein A
MEKKIRLGSEEIRNITLFETLTGARVKDCVQEGNTIGFLIENGDMGLAIGKNGSRIAQVRNVMGKSILVMEFFKDATEFIKNLFHPVKVRNIHAYGANNNGKIAVIEISKRDRSKTIGSGGVRIKIARKFAKRHFGIKDIKVKVL